MTLKDISFPDPRDNLLYDEILFELSEKDTAGEFLRFWESPSIFVVLGRVSKETDVRWEAVRRDRIPVLRRFSGGGTVVQGPGCLNFTAVLSKAQDGRLNDLRRSYRLILGKVVDALRAAGVEAQFRPVSDLILTAGERKFSGNAQRRGRRVILHHGTILYHFPLELVEEYLTMPSAVPDYRRGRSHLEFVANVPLPPEAIKETIRRRFECAPGTRPLTAQEHGLLAEFRSRSARGRLSF